MKIREGTRVLVTAGASGIGRRIAAAFLGQGAGVHVCDVAGDRGADLLEELPGVGFTRADVAVPADVERVFADLATRLGGLDVLINNAGIAGPTAPVEQVSPEDWSRTLDVNITGQFLCARLAVPLLKEAGGGSIINLSSVAGRLGYPMRTPYAASKWAVVGFTPEPGHGGGASRDPGERPAAGNGGGGPHPLGHRRQGGGYAKDLCGTGGGAL